MENNPNDLAEQLKACLKASLALLETVDSARIAQAMKGEYISKRCEEYVDRIKDSASIYRELADDLEKQIVRLRLEKTELIQTVAAIKQISATIKSKEFQEALSTFVMFASLLEQIKELTEDGTVRSILGSIR